MASSFAVGQSSAAILLGYNSNGFADHRLEDAFDILSRIGFRSIAVTLGHDLLDPPDRRGVDHAVHTLRPLIERSSVAVTIETGARYLLDPLRKHQPTLISASAEGRRRRLAFLEAAVEVAAGVGANVVSLWSGTADDSAPEGDLFHRLIDGFSTLLQHADRHGIRLGFEPEPGMFIDTMERFARVYAALDHPRFGLTLDVGHVVCLQDGDVASHVQRWRDVLWNVHIEDMRRGAHEHLPFGQGEIDFASVIQAFAGSGYAGPLHVELPRHSHDAVNVARSSFDFLRKYLEPQISRRV